MNKLTLKYLSLNFLLLISLLSSRFGTCNARNSVWKGNRRSIAEGKSSATINVLNYGAKGDGTSDDTKAFENAWVEACKVAGSTLLVPSGSTFLVGPVSFLGKGCKEKIVFQLDGKIIAPTSSSAWGSGLLQWIEFKTLTGITIKGKGIIDGRGSVWWNKSPAYDPADESESITKKDMALRFYGSNGVTVNGITIQNSPQTHLKFDSCVNIQVSDFTTSSPGDSPNTDGIHLQNSKDAVIYRSTLACGDDCISIQTGCSNIYIHDVDCGPGHGISIGGLGKYNTKACVSNITVRDVTMHETTNGVRIKSWQGGSGSVKQVMFSNIQVSNVANPIIIDQYYCDGGGCHNETSAVAVSNINYINIKGTYTKQPIRFACSDSLPCTGLSLSNIALKPATDKARSLDPFCWEAHGEVKTQTLPPIKCLKTKKSPGAASQSNNDAC
ncbi:hypothetical protein CARUB_v10003877mg [Capsella rubella]|uniref:Polygalacturonase n=1 Tax=Capsella rubella TaxID=81985 RepID=R0HDH9_9BRAS|nr:hypothetical protein CARUB_v10003877mg [Capsella rubella]